ncbi:hypothetical protein HDU67_001006 [Dinochytrium kinnereticum]|nr:hypothetical protein HDU67_001006 [Dinochytrium kinnereticum]
MGPDGPRTLCNACGMRWSKGKLVFTKPLAGGSTSALAAGVTGSEVDKAVELEIKKELVTNSQADEEDVAENDEYIGGDEGEENRNAELDNTPEAQDMMVLEKGEEGEDDVSGEALGDHDAGEEVGEEEEDAHLLEDNEGFNHDDIEHDADILSDRHEDDTHAFEEEEEDEEEDVHEHANESHEDIYQSAEESEHIDKSEEADDDTGHGIDEETNDDDTGPGLDEETNDEDTGAAMEEETNDEDTGLALDDDEDDEIEEDDDDVEDVFVMAGEDEGDTIGMGLSSFGEEEEEDDDEESQSY